MEKLQKTYSMKESEINKKWLLIDAEGVVLGRLASQVSNILRGKNKPDYTPSQDMGDNVIIINAEKVVLTGKKEEQKKYFSHSQYPGGFRMTSIKKYIKENPAFIIEHAVKGMLPRTKMGRKVFGNMKVYVGSEHPHTAQKPEKIELAL